MFPWRTNRLLRRALELYAGKHVLDHVLQHGDEALMIDGTTRDLTVAFLDLGDVADVSNRPPDELQGLMPSWFEVLTKGISEGGGTLDTYVGDSMSAWWGADGRTDHPRQAVACARRLLADVDAFNASSERKGWPKLSLRVGIATGLVRLGAYGSTTRLRYSMLGPTVNVASRLCARASAEHPVLLTGSTKGRLGDGISTTLVDTVSVKGQSEPLQIYAA
jgi:adenylate cyclase